MAVIDLERRMESLDQAQYVRIGRCELLRALRARELDPAAVILDPPELLQTMFVFDFLREIPRVGAQRIRRLNRQAILAQVNLAVTLGQLPPSRRQWLATHLPAREGCDPLAGRPQG